MVEKEYKDLAVLNITSRNEGQTYLLQSFHSLEEQLLPTEITGMGRLSNIFSVNMDKFFGKNHNILIPTASFILQNVIFDQVKILTFNQDDGSQISVSEGLVITPWLTKIIVSESISEAYDILLEAIKFSKTYISKSALYQGLIK